MLVFFYVDSYLTKIDVAQDDSDWTKVAPKLEPVRISFTPTIKLTNSQSILQGHTFMVIGAAGELPKAPEKPIVFMEGEL